MDAELRHPRFADPDTGVLLESFPGTATQVRLLAALAAGTARRWGVLELAAADHVVAGRALARRGGGAAAPTRTTAPRSSSRASVSGARPATVA